MKAKIKSTGEVIEVMQVYEKGESFYVRLDMLDTIEVRYHISELEFEGIETEGKFAEICLNGIKQDIVYSPNYWTKLKHQYAGMALQGMLANIDLLMSLVKKKDPDYPAKYTVAEFAEACAEALVEKLKEKNA